MAHPLPADTSSSPTPIGHGRTTRHDTDALDTLFLADEMTPWLSPAYGAANVVMQLANSAVGYGVMESKVDSGNLYKRPFKRARTTFTYIAVAVAGTARDRRTYREAINVAHAQVRSTPDSPVAYNAFDPSLQLWVAACMAAVFEDTRRLRGGRTVHDPDKIYQAASVFATTLQVPREMWPADRNAFDRYWTEQLNSMSFDDAMREYLFGIASLDFLPIPLPAAVGRWNLFLTMGYLPPQLREQLGYVWTTEHQRRFTRWLSVFRVLDRLTPRVMARAAMKSVVWDMRLRYITGLTVV